MFGELLDTAPADAEPVGDVLRVEFVVDHQPTNLGDIAGIQPRLMGTIERSIN